MISFFNKKIFLVDYLEGFVDIHNHILPGIDDGAKTIQDSISLLKGFSEFGVTKCIATPHIMNNYYPNTPKTITDALQLLKGELVKNDLGHLSINPAAEYMIDDNFEYILEKGKIMPIKNRFVLVEMSYWQPSINFSQAISNIAKNKYYTILAHPERYAYLHDKFSKYNEYKQKGILFQLNFLSLGGYYGKEVKKNALKLIHNELIDFVASDLHNIHQLNALKELTVSKKTIKKLLPIITNTTRFFK